MFCNAARKNNVKVPDVVQTARTMSTHIPSEGPESQPQEEIPRNWWVAQAGALCTPIMPRIELKIPFWS
jgi:hypothetical protein